MALAMPKSMTFPAPVLLIMMLAGLTSDGRCRLVAEVQRLSGVGDHLDGPARFDRSFVRTMSRT